MAIIYLITNTINGKQYVGFTTDLISRKRDHIKRAKRGYAGKLYSAMRKHGVDHFEFDVVFEHDDPKWTLRVMEPYYIQWYDTFESGYNLTLGGEGTIGTKHGAKFKQKVSDQWKGVPKTESHKCSISRALRGKKHTKQRIEKNRLSQPHAKAVSIDGDVFPSASAAARHLGCHQSTVMRAIKKKRPYKGHSLSYIPH